MADAAHMKGFTEDGGMIIDAKDWGFVAEQRLSGEDPRKVVANYLQTMTDNLSPGVATDFSKKLDKINNDHTKATIMTYGKNEVGVVTNKDGDLKGALLNVKAGDDVFTEYVSKSDMLSKLADKDAQESSYIGTIEAKIDKVFSKYE